MIGDLSPGQFFYRQAMVQNRGFGDISPEMATLNTSESEPALFPAKKGQKPPPIFHIKKTDPPIIFIVFLCGNFSHANSKLQKIN